MESSIFTNIEETSPINIVEAKMKQRYVLVNDQDKLEAIRENEREKTLFDKKSEREKFFNKRRMVIKVDKHKSLKENPTINLNEFETFKANFVVCY